MISQFERDILTRTDVAKPDTPYEYPTVAYIAWYSDTATTRGGVEMGRVRWTFTEEHNVNGTGQLTVSASPFPGAWTYVKEEDILCVRHPEAML